MDSVKSTAEGIDFCDCKGMPVRFELPSGKWIVECRDCGYRSEEQQNMHWAALQWNKEQRGKSAK